MQQHPPDEAAGWHATQDLFRELRRIMQEASGPEDSLSQLVAMIADYFGAEVCSLYVGADEQPLTLAATRGLRAEAVGRTRLNWGEGLVGQIAQTASPLALEDAQSHPAFVYRPETGEEAFQSFMGVPLLRGGRVRGVLVVQNQSRRDYPAAEVEACETLALVVADLLQRSDSPEPGEAALLGQATAPARLGAAVLGGGLASGRAVFYHRDIAIRRVRGESPEQEAMRLEQALGVLERGLQDDRVGADREQEEPILELLGVELMMLRDRGWRGKIMAAIERGLSAEAAVRSVQNEVRERMSAIDDPYLRERLADMDELAWRLLLELTGERKNAALTDLPEDSILIARSISPSDLLNCPRDKLRGLIVTEASPTSHIAVIAKSLQLPALGQVRDALTRIQKGDRLIVDAESGQVFLRPLAEVQQRFEQHIAERDRRKKQDRAQTHLPAVSSDGQAVKLLANAALLIDLPQIKEAGGEGIGLYRTEIAFMARHSLPSVAEQSHFYRQVIDEMAGREVIFRTLDLGADKQLPYLSPKSHEADGPAAEAIETNPALGWRALRLGLDEEDLLRSQLQALVEAAAGRPLKVMFPMVTEVREFTRAKALLEAVLADWRAGGGEAPASLRVGAMLEVPILLWDLERLFAHCDFVSLGSNDLLQFLFAADRDNPKLAGRFELLSPAVLRLLTAAAEAAARAGKPITACGEMAGDPLGALALIGCGYRRLSMAPASLPRIKALVRKLDLGSLQDKVRRMAASDSDGLRDELRALAGEEA